MEKIINVYESHWLVPYVIEFILAFIIFYLIYAIFFNRKRKNYIQGKKYADIEFFVKRYNVDVKKVGYKRLLKTITLMNSLILSLTYMIFTNIKSILWAILVGFAVGFILIYSLYEIVGRHFKKIGEDEKCITQKK